MTVTYESGMGDLTPSVLQLFNPSLSFKFLWFLGTFCLIVAGNIAWAQIDQTTIDKAVSNPEKSIFYTRDAFDFPTQDTSFIGSVKLIYDRDSLPVKYVSILSTPVCDDGLCQVLELKIYWNLIGNYVYFDTLTHVPLTKYDHLPFTGDDYAKLHQILANQNSVLERKSLDELFDRDSLRQSNTVDATTGATDQAIKHAVVEGALYSSYALWHLANGDIKANIQEYTKSIYSLELMEKLLRSNDYQEQLFALKLFEDQDFEIYFYSVLNLMITSNPLLEMYILKKIPDAIWSNPIFQNQLVRTFPELTPNGRGLLFSKLSEMNAIENTTLIFLSEHIREMSINQLKVYLKMLKKYRMEEHIVIQGNLKSAIISMEDKAFYIDAFLNQVK